MNRLPNMMPTSTFTIRRRWVMVWKEKVDISFVRKQLVLDYLQGHWQGRQPTSSQWVTVITNSHRQWLVCGRDTQCLVVVSLSVNQRVVKKENKRAVSHQDAMARYSSLIEWKAASFVHHVFYLMHLITIKFVNGFSLTESRFAFMKPRLMSTDLWFDCDVSSAPADSGSCSLMTLRGYCFRSCSMLGMKSPSLKKSSDLPFSAFVLRTWILSSPYSPHASSITEKTSYS